MECISQADVGDTCVDRETSVNNVKIKIPEEIALNQVTSLATGSYVIRNYSIGSVYSKYYFVKSGIAREQWQTTSQHNFNVVIEASGSVKVIDVFGSGAYAYTRGTQAKGTKCDTYQMWRRDFFLDFEQYKVYSDGKKVLIPNSRFSQLQKYDDIPQPAKNWYAC